MDLFGTDWNLHTRAFSSFLRLCLRRFVCSRLNVFIFTPVTARFGLRFLRCFCTCHVMEAQSLLQSVVEEALSVELDIEADGSGTVRPNNLPLHTG